MKFLRNAREKSFYTATVDEIKNNFEDFLQCDDCLAIVYKESEECPECTHCVFFDDEEKRYSLLALEHDYLTDELTVMVKYEIMELGV